MSNTRAFLAKLVEAESPEEFMCLHPGTMETMEGEARSVEVKAGEQDGPQEPTEPTTEELQGWSVSFRERTVNKVADPTAVMDITLSKEGQPDIEINEMFGVYVINLEQFSPGKPCTPGDYGKRAAKWADKKLSELGAPSMDVIGKAITWQQYSASEDPMGPPSRYESGNSRTPSNQRRRVRGSNSQAAHCPECHEDFPIDLAKKGKRPETIICPRCGETIDDPVDEGPWNNESTNMNSIQQLLKNLVSEDAGTLDEVPDAWKKLFTNSGAGDQSEIVLVKKNLRSSRELGTLVKSGPNAEIAGYFMKKTDGTPVGIIRYTGEGGKPWQLIQPSGEAVTKKEVNYRRLPSWRQPTRTYTDGQGKVVRYKDRNATERYEFQRRDVSLNEISNVISFADGIDLYAMKKDVARAAKHADRQAARAGQDSDIDNIRNGVAGKFLASKTGGPRERLKARIAAISDEIKKKLEDAAATADSGGELSRGQTFDTKKVEELNTLLYDLSHLSQLVKDSSKEGPYRRGSQSWSNPSGPHDKNWGYSSLTNKLAVIQQKLAKLDDGGRYESLVRQALRQAASMV
jgi:hypothetical protein